MLHKLKIEVCEANLALRNAGLVILTWGNVSARDPSGEHIVIKPSGVSYDKMLPEQMVVVALDGTVVEGDFRPSSDTPTHLEIYRAWPEVGGVVHTHSTYATAWAQAWRPLPCYGTTHADSFRGPVPVTEPLADADIEGDYEAATGRAILRTFEGRSPMEVPAVLVGGHGPFTWGRSASHAVENSIVLEQVALTALLTEGLNADAREIPVLLRDRHFLRKHGPGAYYGQASGTGR
jgi:L-ribulose-5-phosphate 4-epimerase